MMARAVFAALILVASTALTTAAAEAAVAGPDYEKLHDSLVLRAQKVSPFDAAFRFRGPPLLPPAVAPPRDLLAPRPAKLPLIPVIAWGGGSAGIGARDGLGLGLTSRRAMTDDAPPSTLSPSAPSVKATNVVQITVSHVALPAGFPGLCRVAGTVDEVWEGKTFSPGQAIIIPVPCQAHGGVTPTRSELAAPLDAVLLAKGKHGLARVDDSGQLVWQDDADDVSTDNKPFARFAAVRGYRVLNGAVLTVAPRRL